MPDAPRETSVEHEVRVAADPEVVFAYFTDPARMVQWMGATVTLDPRPGGIFRLVFRPTRQVTDLLGMEAGAENVVLGEFVEVAPYERIVFTWGYEREHYAMPPQSTAVEVTLTPEGDETLVRLVHRQLPEAAAAFHAAGWDVYLPRLAVAAAGGDPGPDPFQAG
jgi:uncharacterized protein YndB with AHSA1/START domain